MHQFDDRTPPPTLAVAASEVLCVAYANPDVSKGGTLQVSTMTPQGNIGVTPCAETCNSLRAREIGRGQ